MSNWVDSKDVEYICAKLHRTSLLLCYQNSICWIHTVPYKSLWLFTPTSKLIVETKLFCSCFDFQLHLTVTKTHTSLKYNIYSIKGLKYNGGNHWGKPYLNKKNGGQEKEREFHLFKCHLHTINKKKTYSYKLTYSSQH